jgi:hypothetical protein
MCHAVPLWLSLVKRLIRNQQIMGSNPISGYRAKTIEIALFLSSSEHGRPRNIAIAS